MVSLIGSVLIGLLIELPAIIWLKTMTTTSRMPMCRHGHQLDADADVGDRNIAIVLEVCY